MSQEGLIPWIILIIGVVIISATNIYFMIKGYKENKKDSD